MSVPDREQLIRQIADEISSDAHNDWRWRVSCVVETLERLGYSVTPVESPAEAAEQRPPSLGAFATTVMAHMAHGDLLFGQRQRYWSPDIEGDIEPMKDPETLDSVWSFLTWLEREVKLIRSRRAAVETEETPT